MQVAIYHFSVHVNGIIVSIAYLVHWQMTD